MRKIISLFLTLALIAGLCSWAGAEESYNLDIYWVGNGDNPQIREGVEQAINHYLEPQLGITVTFHIIAWDDWNTQAIDALRAGTKMDLIFTADWEGYFPGFRSAPEGARHQGGRNDLRQCYGRI